MREVREVKCETFTGIMLTMLFVGMLTLVFSVQQAEVAEPPAAEWSRTYGGTSFDGALSFVQTSDGGYALAGYTFSFGAGDSDAWLVKVDSNGNMQWNKTYGGTERDIGMNTVETSDGGSELVTMMLGWLRLEPNARTCLFLTKHKAMLRGVGLHQPRWY